MILGVLVLMRHTFRVITLRDVEWDFSRKSFGALH